MSSDIGQPAHPADSPWAADVVLSTGDTAYIRPLTVDDKADLLAFHERQSDESIYRRYFSPKPTLTERELDHFTNVDMVNRVALAVEMQDRMVAWASYERWPGRNEAEAAFMVDDELHGHGIATLLLEHLAAIARSNGVERFTAEVLGDNRGMLAVFSKAGWPLKRSFDSGVVDLDWELATTDEFLDSVERREQRADSRAVTRLLFPRAIAVVGASDTPDTVGAALWRHVSSSEAAPAYAVNPNRTTVDGQPCFSSVAELPDDVSLAIIAVPAEHVDATIDACIAKRMRGAIIITDVDGIEGYAPGVDVAALVARSRRHGLRLIGPSSMGVAGLQTGNQLQAALVDVTLPAGNVAISLQSGSLGGSVLRQARDLGLGLSWFVSLGDRSDISTNDLLQFWDDDEQTAVIAMYAETFGNPRKFARIARRVSRRRPIVAVRTGAAADGSLGSTIFQQAGVIEVPTVHALLDTARVFSSQPTLAGPRVRTITNSRSPATLADAALRAAGLEPSIDRLPADASPESFHTAIAAALNDDSADGVLVIHAPAVPNEHDTSTAEALDAAAAESRTKPIVSVLLGRPDGPARHGSRVPNFSFPEQAAAVLGRSYGYGRWLANESDTGAETGADTDRVTRIEPGTALGIIDAALARQPAPYGDNGQAVHLDVADAGALLTSYGIVVAPAQTATVDTVVEAANALGYPVAVKAARRGVGRSVKAGIALDLGSDDDVTESVRQMRAALGHDADRLVVQQMTMPGFEVRVRCQHDDQLGAVISVGIGGAHADVIDDQARRLAPLSRSAALAMLNETKVATALAEADIELDALIGLVTRAALLASDQPDLVTVDLNPVIVNADGAMVTDATIVVQRTQRTDTALRRLH